MAMSIVSSAWAVMVLFFLIYSALSLSQRHDEDAYYNNVRKQTWRMQCQCCVNVILKYRVLLHLRVVVLVVTTRLSLNVLTFLQIIY